MLLFEEAARMWSGNRTNLTITLISLKIAHTLFHPSTAVSFGY